MSILGSIAVYGFFLKKTCIFTSKNKNVWHPDNRPYITWYPMWTDKQVDTLPQDDKNSLHWVSDVFFNKDYSGKRTEVPANQQNYVELKKMRNLLREGERWWRVKF